MRRETWPVRPDWQAKVEKWGLVYHTFNGKPYWDESAYYVLNDADVERLESATNELSRISLEAVDYVIQHSRWADFAISPEVAERIKQVWDQDPPAIYGRFDLGYDGESEPKMLEYNADTPTSLLEAAVIQWQWLKEVNPEADQFNSIWEALVAKWRALEQEGLFPNHLIHFGHDESWEDLLTVTVLRDTAAEAGLVTLNIHMDEIGWDSAKNLFVDMQNRPIKTLFKLYPWEWLVHEQFGKQALESFGHVQWIEPIWKMVLSNKALLAILWEMYPGHKNLLETHLGDPKGLTNYVKKPLLSREGANVTIVKGVEVEATSGDYGEEGYVCQALYDLPMFDGKHPVIGSWVVDCASCGVGIRESVGLITDDLACFVPHKIGN